MLVSEGKELGRSYTPDPRTEAGGFYRSDHFPFAKQGVPAISFGAGRDLVEGGVERSKALSEVYTRDRYHQPADEWSADWDLSSVVPDLTLLYNLGHSLANRSEEHTPELQSLMRISYAVFCLKNKTSTHTRQHTSTTT